MRRATMLFVLCCVFLFGLTTSVFADVHYGTTGDDVHDVTAGDTIVDPGGNDIYQIPYAPGTTTTIEDYGGLDSLVCESGVVISMSSALNGGPDGDFRLRPLSPIGSPSGQIVVSNHNVDESRSMELWGAEDIPLVRCVVWLWSGNDNIVRSLPYSLTYNSAVSPLAAQLEDFLGNDGYHIRQGDSWSVVDHAGDDTYWFPFLGLAPGRPSATVTVDDSGGLDVVDLGVLNHESSIEDIEVEFVDDAVTVRLYGPDRTDPPWAVLTVLSWRETSHAIESVTISNNIVGGGEWFSGSLAELIALKQTDDIADLIASVDDAVADGTLAGIGPGSSASGKLGAFQNMLASAEASITAGDYAGALDQLKATYAKCDGNPIPPDLVTGDARVAIAAEILKLMAKLEAMMP